MPFTGDDRQKLIAELEVSFSQYAQLGPFLMTRLNEPLGNVSPPEPLTIVFDRLLNWAESVGREIDLLDALAVEFPARATLQAVTNGLKKKLRLNPQFVFHDPYDACLPRTRSPFINRRELRSALRDLVTGNASVLVVNGPRKSGKSYTLELIHFLQQAIGGFRAVNLSLNEDTGNYSPTDIARSFLRQLGRSERIGLIPVRQTEDSEVRHAAEIRDWLVGELVNAVRDLQLRGVWIVLDGFSKAVSVPDDFVRLLTIHAHRSVPELRVVLLDYSKPVPEIERNILREHITAVTEADLDQFLAHLVASAVPPMPLPGADPEWIAIKALLKETTPDVLEEVNGRLLTRLRAWIPGYGSSALTGGS